MKRTHRVIATTKILSENPNKTYSLNYFSELFSCAKSSISEDLQIISDIFSEHEWGFIETSYGAGGGIKYIPLIEKEAAIESIEKICKQLCETSRILGNGFIYTSDIMFNPKVMESAAKIFASLFFKKGADFIVTLETKGIPVALLTAKLLNLPLVVIRRESKISEGSTLSINYISGTNQHVQKMSLSKRAVVSGTKALVIDDFMRAGGSIKGIRDILEEFEIEVVGTGVVIASKTGEKKKVTDYVPLIYLEKADFEEKTISIYPNEDIFATKDK